MAVSADNDHRLVMIEWKDSAQPMPEWQYLSALECGGAVKCASVGWLLQDDEHVKSLAPNMGEIGRPETIQISGLIRIPTRCVTRLVRLREDER